MDGVRIGSCVRAHETKLKFCTWDQNRHVIENAKINSSTECMPTRRCADQSNDATTKLKSEWESKELKLIAAL